MADNTRSVKKLKDRIRELESYIRGMKEAIYLSNPKGD